LNPIESFKITSNLYNKTEKVKNIDDLKEPGWQYLFPAKVVSFDPRSNKKRRHHVFESSLQKAVRKGGR